MWNNATEREYSWVILRSILLRPSMKCEFVCFPGKDYICLSICLWCPQAQQTNHLASWFKSETSSAFSLLGVLDRKYQNSLWISWWYYSICPCLRKSIWIVYQVSLGILKFTILSANSSYIKFCGTPKTFESSCVVFAEMIHTVTHSDKHMGEGSSGVFRHIDRRDDPVSLLSPQPIGRRASLMFSRKLDNSGLGFPDSWQHFFKANLKRKKPNILYHATSCFE